MPFFIGKRGENVAVDFYQALTRRQPVSDWLYQARDLTCLRVNSGWQLVFACDSLGGIGEKPLDSAQATAETVGHFSLRVPLMEVIATGARPFLIIDTLSVEAGAYGRAILTGIRRLAAEVGLVDDVHFNGSMEKNLIPLQTGVGVTVVGMVDDAHIRIGTATSGDAILLVGKPKSAPMHEVWIGDPEMVSLQEVEWLRQQDGVHDIVPVGSGGVAEEARQLAEFAHLSLSMKEEHPEDTVSGGPNTSVLMACREDVVADIQKKLRSPWREVGRLLG